MSGRFCGFAVVLISIARALAGMVVWRPAKKALLLHLFEME